MQSMKLNFELKHDTISFSSSNSIVKCVDVDKIMDHYYLKSMTSATEYLCTTSRGERSVPDAGSQVLNGIFIRELVQLFTLPTLLTF